MALRFWLCVLKFSIGSLGLYCTEDHLLTCFCRLEQSATTLHGTTNGARAKSVAVILAPCVRTTG